MHAIAAKTVLHRLLPVVLLSLLSGPSLPAGLAGQEPAGEEGAGLPLEPTRTISFTAREGTWMSVDVSPDGETLVFDLLGDLYLLPAEGGEATPLTRGMPFDAQPRFSPDGAWILYVSDGSGAQNLRAIRPDGSDTLHITEGEGSIYTSPEWTPDGEYVVASKTFGLGGAAKLWLWHVDGGSGTRLVDAPEDRKMLGAAFGPDPRYVWYAEREGDWSYNAILPEYQLAVHDRETGTKTSMSARYGSGFRPALSPDGRWLAYGTRHDEHTGIRLRELETGEERWLAHPVQRDDQEARATLDVLPGYAFTPDSGALVLSYGGRLWRVPLDGSGAEEIPFTAPVELSLGPELDFDYEVDDAPTFAASQIRDVVPSPDGERIVFTAVDRLWIADRPDGEPRRLTDDETGEYHPTWSPDGRWIAYVTWDREEGGRVRRVRARAGSEPERLTDAPGYYRRPAWSPDGGRIAAVRSPRRARRPSAGFGGLGADLVRIPAEGGDVRLVAPAGDRRHPHFTDDPDRIWAYSPSEGLVSMRWDGTDVRHHLKVTGATRRGGDRPMPARIVLAGPDGEMAVAEVETRLYAMPIPLVGETPTVSVASPESAIVPVRDLAGIGGRFPAWGADGREVHFSLGDARFVYDLRRARAVEDSLEAAGEEAPEAGGEPGEEAAGEGAEAADEAGYRPEERRVRVEVERDIPRGALVLRGVRAITMRGDEIIEDADIVVVDHRIRAVGPRGEVETPPDARVMELPGKTVIPGFVDPHAHLRPAFDIHETQPYEYLANLAYGVTMTRDPQTSTTDVLAYSDRVERGAILGPRIYSTGPGVFGDYVGTDIRDQEHAREILRRYSEYYDTKMFKMYLSGNREQRQWLIRAAREQGLRPTTEAGIDFALDLTHAMDGYPGIEHNLPIYPIYDDVVRLFSESGVLNTPTLIVSFGGPFGENWFYTREEVHDDRKLRRFVPHPVIDSKAQRRGGTPGPAGWARTEEYVFADHARFLADVVEAGGKIGVGSHGQLQGLGFHWELWMVGSGGMSEHDALRAATILGAEGMGFDGDLGSIEPGKLADLVILDGDPLVDIRNSLSIGYVMKNGRLYEGETLDEVWPRERPLPAGVVHDEPDVEAGVR